LNWMRDTTINKQINLWFSGCGGFRDLRWEEPNISRSKVIDKSLTIFIYSLSSLLIFTLGELREIECIPGSDKTHSE
jgi:hypothetical protein